MQIALDMINDQRGITAIGYARRIRLNLAAPRAPTGKSYWR